VRGVFSCDISSVSEAEGDTVTIEQRTEIWRERGRLEQERRDAMRRLMAEFDKEHYAKLRALRDRCAAIGHVRGKFDSNGLGTTWFYCNQCGDRMEVDHGD
jgi:hypothetical protein